MVGVCEARLRQGMAVEAQSRDCAERSARRCNGGPIHTRSAMMPLDQHAGMLPAFGLAPARPAAGAFGLARPCVAAAAALQHTCNRAKVLPRFAISWRGLESRPITCPCPMFRCTACI
jgi:hypothetical protein